MKLPVENPKTIEDVNKNMEFLAKFIISKDIVSGVEAVDTTTVNSGDAGTNTVINDLRTKLDLLVNNIKGQ